MPIKKGTILINYNELIGTKFGRLTVISLARSGSSALYNVRCDCGTEKTVHRKSLLKNGTKSCGCLRRETRPNKDGSFYKVLWTYKNNAIKRNLEFNLTIDQFKNITKQNCYYCGTTPNQICKTSRNNEEYVYNGIDRKHNNIGYTLENCVSCCKICNNAKSDLTLIEFLDWIKRLKKWQLN